MSDLRLEEFDLRGWCGDDAAYAWRASDDTWRLRCVAHGGVAVPAEWLRDE